MRNLYCLLLTLALIGLTYPLLAQSTLKSKPLFDFKKEFAPQLVGNLKPGERFIIPATEESDNNLPSLYTVSTMNKQYKVGAATMAKPLKGKTFTLVAVQMVKDAPGGEQAIAVLTTDNKAYAALMGNTLDALKTRGDLTRIAGFVRLAEVEKARKLLEGQVIYPLVQYVKKESKPDNYLYLPKYVPVKVTKVAVGDRFQPVELTFTYLTENNYTLSRGFSFDGQGYTGSNPNPYMLDNFTDCFTLADPRLTNDTMNEAMWKIIQKGVPQQGMTKDQCRLAMGKPAEEADRADQNQVTVWYYPNHLGRSWQIAFINGKLAQAPSYKSSR